MEAMIARNKEPYCDEQPLDAAKIKACLRPSERPAGITQSEVDEGIRYLVEHANQRIVLNQSGGLPRPPETHTSLPRIAMRFVEGLFKR